MYFQYSVKDAILSVKILLCLQIERKADMNSFADMEEHLVNSSIGNKLSRIKGIEKNVYRGTLDGAFMRYIRKDGGGWMLEEYFKEELLAENVQLIGNRIERLLRQFNY